MYGGTNMFIVKIKKSCIVTYLGLIFGVLASYFAFNKVAFNEVDKLRYALAFFILSGICDMFDGKVARACKRDEEEKEFGIQLDSLADTFNFLAVPIIIMLSLKMDTVVCIVAYSLLVLCGVARLAYFNVHAELDGPVKYYKGLPVTTTAIIYPLLGLLHGNIADATFKIVYLVATFVIAFLFVLDFKCPKLKGIFYVIVPVLAAALIALLLLI